MKRNPLHTIGMVLGAVAFLVPVAGTGQLAPIQVPGFLKFEVYTNIAGTTVQDLLNSPSYPASPGRTFYLTTFNTRSVYGDDTHDNYGGAISGSLTPTESGDFELFLRSDDSSELFLSADDNPANLVKIAEETTCCGAFEESGAPETSPAQTLVAGQRYAIRVLFKEGGGGDFCQVAMRRVGDTTPAAQLQPIPGALLSSLIAPQGTITITTQPAAASGTANGFVSMSVQFTATHGPSVVQWQKNGVSVPGLVGPTLSVGPLTLADDGSRFRAVISTPGAVANSAEATLSVSADVTPPTIRRVVSTDTFDGLIVEYSEAMKPEVGDFLNYSLDGGLTVNGASIINPTTVRLQTSPLTPATPYVLGAFFVSDLAGNEIAPNTRFTFSTLDLVRGGLKFEAYLGIAGNAVGDLTSHPNYPASPDVVAYVTQFSSRQIYADAASVDTYGGRLSGWITPPESAEYEFFIRSDDGSQLSLSVDESPANAVVIAAEGGCCGPFEDPGAPETSARIALNAGSRYYLEALWKEGNGGDYCDVAYRKVGDPTPARALPYISGSVMETYAVPGTFTVPTVRFSSPAGGSSFDVGVPVTLTVDASAAAPKTITKVEFFRQGREIGEVNTSPYALTLWDLGEDTHTFIARATDSAGLTADTPPFSITVGGAPMRIPLLAIDNVTQWRYDRTGRDLTTEWLALDYDDSTWPQGKTLIADEGTTTVEPIRTQISRFNDQGQYVKTFYFRTHFDFPGAVAPDVQLQLRHVIDDGAVFYLNGLEVHRFGIAPGPVTAATDAAGHENVYEGPYSLPIDGLRTGDNILMAEVHQSGGSSSDMVFGCELVGLCPVVRTNLELAAINDITTWRYDRTGRELGTEWRQPGYDDSSWPSGKTLIADEGTTTVEPIRTAISRFNDQGQYVKTFYFRTHFDLPVTTTAGARLRLRHVVDDGAVIYLNGAEIHRFGIAAGVVVDSTTDAAGHENVYEGPYDIPLDNLRPGDNVLAAEVHQAGAGSSDMVFGAELIASVELSCLSTPGQTVLTASREGVNVSISWTPTGGTLESAPAMLGPWDPVTGATSPHPVNANEPARFFRVRR